MQIDFRCKGECAMACIIGLKTFVHQYMTDQLYLCRIQSNLFENIGEVEYCPYSSSFRMLAIKAEVQ